MVPFPWVPHGLEGVRDLDPGDRDTQRPRDLLRPLFRTQVTESRLKRKSFPSRVLRVDRGDVFREGLSRVHLLQT